MITDQDCVQAETYEYKGLSTDTKPTNCAVNSLFLELDTGDFYFFNGTEWGKINSTIQLGEDPTGTIQITNNGIFDVHNYAEADVDVPAIIPTGTISITENGTVDVANYAEASVDVDATVNFNLPALTRSIPTALSTARMYLAATNVGNYALFGGGYTGSFTDVVDAYDTSLTRTTPTVLSSGRFYLTATSVGNYALFAGGRGVPLYATIDAYDQNLTRTTPPVLSEGRDKLASTTVGNYALFGGGQPSAFSGNSNVVDAYDQNLTLQTAPAVLSQARRSLAATTVASAGGSNPQSGYALFAGGTDGSSYFDVVDAYSETLDKVTSPDILSEGVSNLAATSIAAVESSSPQSGYALFGGGETASSYTNKLNAYNENLDKVVSVANLSQARGYLAATNVGNYALFGGGVWSAGLNLVEPYDSSLTKVAPNPQALSEGRYGLSAASVGSYALFGGGISSSYSDVVDAYSPYHDIQVFPETKYSFNGSTEQTSSTWQTISMQGEVVGYIKVKDATVN